jgi:hypothetical protein
MVAPNKFDKPQRGVLLALGFNPKQAALRETKTAPLRLCAKYSCPNQLGRDRDGKQKWRKATLVLGLKVSGLNISGLKKTIQYLRKFPGQILTRKLLRTVGISCQGAC